MGATVAEFNLFGANDTGLLGAASAAGNGTTTVVGTVSPSTTSGIPDVVATASLPVIPTGSGSSTTSASGVATATSSDGEKTRQLGPWDLALTVSAVIFSALWER